MAYYVHVMKGDNGKPGLEHRFLPGLRVSGPFRTYIQSVQECSALLAESGVKHMIVEDEDG
jgi:hypothetical protein